jgi:hypothetical protein
VILLSLDIPQCCKGKLMTFLQLGHQQGITSISEIKKKERKKEKSSDHIINMLIV